MTLAELEFLPAAKKTDSEERMRLLNSIRPRITEQYTKHIPHPAQQLFLLQSAKEVLYGGAAGGGKSDALIMAALQYVDVPGYAALLLRRTWPDLSLPGAIMDRASQWLLNTDAVPKEGGRTWVFPSGARITFGYLQHDKDKYRYQSAEFQFIGFDELTQFQQPTYEYMFSRIRRPNLVCVRCQQPVAKYHAAHGAQWKHRSSGSRCSNLLPDPKMLHEYGPAKDGRTLFDVPLRMRSATNPGGIGHQWVRERFIDPDLRRPGSIFIPATLSDNPSLDQETYRENLAHLNPLDRERLMNGDWDVTEEGAFFQRHWFKFLREEPLDNRIRWTRYWDMAATAEGDYTAGCLIGLTPDGEWIISDMRRMRGTPREVERFVYQTANDDGSRVPIRMEQEPGSSGVMVIDHYRRNILVGFDFRADKKTGSKETRANPVSSAAEAGNISLVIGKWNREFLDEVSIFPYGANDDQCLSGDTMLITPQGRKAIRDIEVGDIVYGQSGWVTVSASAMTSPRARTTNRFGLRATDNHPVWTNKGWVNFSHVTNDAILTLCDVRGQTATVWQSRADCVSDVISAADVSSKAYHPDPRKSPRVELTGARAAASTSKDCVLSTTADTESMATPPSWKAQNRGLSGWTVSSSTALRSAGTQTRSNRLTAGTTSREVSGSNKGYRHSTKRYGSPTTGRSLRGTMSTTGMETSQTMTSPTWYASPTWIIGPSIPKDDLPGRQLPSSWPILNPFDQWQPNGTSHPRDANGTESTPRRWDSESTVEPVYNITTSDGTYYANGILVHNCDAMTGGFHTIASRKARILA